MSRWGRGANKTSQPTCGLSQLGYLFNSGNRIYFDLRSWALAWFFKSVWCMWSLMGLADVRYARYVLSFFLFPKGPTWIEEFNVKMQKFPSNWRVWSREKLRKKIARNQGGYNQKSTNTTRRWRMKCNTEKKKPNFYIPGIQGDRFYTPRCVFVPALVIIQYSYNTQLFSRALLFCVG